MPAPNDKAKEDQEAAKEAEEAAALLAAEEAAAKEAAKAKPGDGDDGASKPDDKPSEAQVLKQSFDEERKRLEESAKTQDERYREDLGLAQQEIADLKAAAATAAKPTKDDASVDDLGPQPDFADDPDAWAAWTEQKLEQAVSKKALANTQAELSKQKAEEKRLADEAKSNEEWIEQAHRYIKEFHANSDGTPKLPNEIPGLAVELESYMAYGREHKINDVVYARKFKELSDPMLIEQKGLEALRKKHASYKERVGQVIEPEDLKDDEVHDTGWDQLADMAKKALSSTE